jgi:hypothetical protein
VRMRLLPRAENERVPAGPVLHPQGGISRQQRRFPSRPQVVASDLSKLGLHRRTSIPLATTELLIMTSNNPLHGASRTGGF